MTTPTPDEARRALDTVEQSRQRSAAAAAWPLGWWIAGGVLLIAWGVALDLKPAWASWAPSVVFPLTAVAVLVGSRRGGAAIGRRTRPRITGVLPRLVVASVIVLFIVGAYVLRTTGVAHLSSVLGVAGGLLVAVGGPWWQHHLLSRSARS